MSVSRVTPESLPEINETVTKVWCNTRMKKHKISYTWTINDFSSCPQKTGEFLKSSTFSADDNDDLKWHLKIYPKGENEHRDFVALYLCLDSGKSEVRTQYKFSLLNATKEKVNVMESVQVFGTSWGTNQFIRQDFLLSKENGLLPGDILTINCEVSVLSDADIICGRSSGEQCKIPVSMLSQDLGNIFVNAKFTDVTLSVDGREFQAHKNILAARSVVFAAMFEHEMEETKLNRVNITDIGQEVLEEMLHFIYTDESPNLNKMARALLVAADKYALEKLKVMCEEALRVNLSMETAAETFKFADRHNAVQLKAHTNEFLNANITEFMKTDGWENLFNVWNNKK